MVVLLALLSTWVIAQNAETLYQQIEIGLGATKQAKRYHILDLGPVGEDTTRSMELQVTNTSDKVISLTVFSVGSKVSAIWNDSGTDSTQTEFTAGQTKSVRVSFNAGKQTAQDFNMITFNEDRSVVTSVVIDYSVHKKQIPINIDTTRLASGVGTSYNEPPYVLCSGPAPIGYTRIGHPSEFWISCWNCIAGCPGDTYAECRSIQISDKNVCYSVKIQGNGQDSTVKYAEVHLHVLYQLKEFPPVLDPLPPAPSK